MPINLLCWTDIPVTDLGRAIGFYSAVLAAPVTRQAHENFEMGVLPHSGDNPAGCLSPSSENKPSVHGPLIYLSVEGRLDAAIEAVAPAGGKVLEPKKPIGPWGFRALILDTEGNRIALHSMKA
jgi:predicted enzyme related to lactoylglutathione lyase